MPLSVVLITFNEEQTITRCLKSVSGLADEIVVVDSFSTDRTVELCQQMGAKVVEKAFMGFGPQKQFAVEQATFDHVLCLDADEALSETLRDSVRDCKNRFDADGYTFHRLNHYCNTPIRHGGWYPDVQLRLFDRRAIQWNLDSVHEKPSGGKAVILKPLKGDLLHYTCQTPQEHQSKELRYAELNAQMLIDNQRKIAACTPYLKSAFRFVKTFLFQGGFLDGRYGWIIAKTVAKSSFRKYALARAKMRNKPQ